MSGLEVEVATPRPGLQLGRVLLAKGRLEPWRLERAIGASAEDLAAHVPGQRLSCSCAWHVVTPSSVLELHLSETDLSGGALLGKLQTFLGTFDWNGQAEVDLSPLPDAKLALMLHTTEAGPCSSIEVWHRGGCMNYTAKGHGLVKVLAGDIRRVSAGGAAEEAAEEPAEEAAEGAAEEPAEGAETAPKS